MWMRIAPAALGLALSTCPFAGEEPGAYARITGVVLRETGAPYHGSVFLACGGSGREARTDGHGRYAVEYTVGPLPPGEGSAEGELLLRCRVNAPADRPPFAQRYALVPFHRERGRRESTRIDLVEGQVEDDPGPAS